MVIGDCISAVQTPAALLSVLYDVVLQLLVAAIQDHQMLILHPKWVALVVTGGGLIED